MRNCACVCTHTHRLGSLLWLRSAPAFGVCEEVNGNSCRVSDRLSSVRSPQALKDPEMLLCVSGGACELRLGTLEMLILRAAPRGDRREQWDRN